MSKKLKYLKRDGTGDVIKADEFVGTKLEEYIVRANDLERIKGFMNGKVDSYLNEGADITENDTDWTNETELKALLTSGELVNIKSLGLGSAAGLIGTLDVDGRITMVGLHLAPDPTSDDIGVIEITFDATGKITGINMFTRYATLKYVDDELAKKQDKLSATQLLVVNANPFTTAEKTKLAGLQNADLTDYYKKSETLSKAEIATANTTTLNSAKAYTDTEIAKIPASIPSPDWTHKLSANQVPFYDTINGKWVIATWTIIWNNVGNTSYTFNTATSHPTFYDLALRLSTRVSGATQYNSGITEYTMDQYRQKIIEGMTNIQQSDASSFSNYSTSNTSIARTEGSSGGQMWILRYTKDWPLIGGVS